MSDLAIVIMAAGLGSRFGGTKQLVDVGPNGEVFFDFAIADSIAAGADRVVLIVRREFADTVEEHVRSMHGDIDIHLVCQDETNAPTRKKPWGTAHAILAAKGAVDRPFIVVNADDYYGVESYQLVADELREAGESTVVLAAFELCRTLPNEGSVSRGGRRRRRRGEAALDHHPEPALRLWVRPQDLRQAVDDLPAGEALGERLDRVAPSQEHDRVARVEELLGGERAAGAAAEVVDEADAVFFQGHGCPPRGDADDGAGEGACGRRGRSGGEG